MKTWEQQHSNRAHMQPEAWETVNASRRTQWWEQREELQALVMERGKLREQIHGLERELEL